MTGETTPQPTKVAETEKPRIVHGLNDEQPSAPKDEPASEMEPKEEPKAIVPEPVQFTPIVEEPVRHTPTIHQIDEPAPTVKVFDNPFASGNREDDGFEITSYQSSQVTSQAKVSPLQESVEVDTLVEEAPEVKPYDPKEELKRNRLRALSLNFKTQKGLEELERVPAYMRREANYEETVADEEVSTYSANSSGISTENSFLHQDVD